MPIYTAIADSNGDFTVPFSSSYTAGQKVIVTAEKDGATKTIELNAPSGEVGGGFVQYEGDLSNFPANVSEVKIVGVIGALNLILKIVGPTTLTIGEGLTSLPAGCLNGWTSIRYLNLPNTLVEIGNSALSGVNPINLIIPNSVEYIRNSAFAGGNLVKSIQIGVGIKVIEANAFYNFWACDLITINAVTPPTISPSTFYDLNGACILKVPSASVDAYKAAPYWSNFSSRIQAI